jgi:hypothetical protein
MGFDLHSAPPNARHESRASARPLQALETYGGLPLRIPRGYAGAGKRRTRARGGDLRRFDTKQHQAYGGIDRHARRMDVCILNPAGAIMLHRNRHASPEPFLKAIAPSRAEMIVAVEGLFTWSWLADLCAQEGSTVGLGPVLSMHAIHGGQATHDTIDAHTMAVWLHGSLLPQASVDPAARRTTRELRRRRMSLVRQRTEWLTPVQQPNSQSHRPELGQNMADQAHCHGVAARLPAPRHRAPHAVPQTPQWPAHEQRALRVYGGKAE